VHRAAVAATACTLPGGRGQRPPGRAPMRAVGQTSGHTRRSMPDNGRISRAARLSRNDCTDKACRGGLPALATHPATAPTAPTALVIRRAGSVSCILLFRADHRSADCRSLDGLLNRGHCEVRLKPAGTGQGRGNDRDHRANRTLLIGELRDIYDS
jgi:hypothetical protein